MTSSSKKTLKPKTGGACINNNSSVIDNPAAKTANINNPSSLPPVSLPKQGTGYYNNVGIGATATLLGTPIYDNADINLNNAELSPTVDSYGIFNQRN